MESVNSKVALITGGASGIGLCMVKELLKNGAKGVAIIDISEELGKNVLNEISGVFGNNKAIFIKADVTIKTELEEAFETTIRTFQQLDIVINNAGIADESDWKKIIDVNLTGVIEGTYLAMQKYLPQYRSGTEGIIVNTASVLGIECVQFAPIYCTTKSGIISLGRALGGEDYYKKYQVRIITICPGKVDTPLTRDADKSKLLFIDKIIEETNAINPINQQPERVGEALIEVIKRGKNGSLWVIEDDTPLYEIAMPSRKTMRVQK